MYVLFHFSYVCQFFKQIGEEEMLSETKNTNWGVFLIFISIFSSLLLAGAFDFNFHFLSADCCWQEGGGGGKVETWQLSQSANLDERQLCHLITHICIFDIVFFYQIVVGMGKSIRDICRFVYTGTIFSWHQRHTNSRFLTPKTTTFKILTPKHTNSHFLDTRLKIWTPALSVTKIRFGEESDRPI